MDSSHRRKRLKNAPWGVFAAALAALTGVVLATPLPPQALLVSVPLFVAMAALVLAGWVRSPALAGFGPANTITLIRALLVLWMATLLAFPGVLSALLWPFALVALAVLALDGVDGAVARRTATSSEFGARFDMELDAFYLLVLCGAVMVLGKAGPWVLALGLMRYAFILAGLAWPGLQQPLPESFRRKTVCVWQGVTLLVSVVPVVSATFAVWTLALALALLTWSFAVDTLWLVRQHRPAPALSGAGTSYEPGPPRPGLVTRRDP